jgi:hypothetical protein
MLRIRTGCSGMQDRGLQSIDFTVLNLQVQYECHCSNCCNPHTPTVGLMFILYSGNDTAIYTGTATGCTRAAHWGAGGGGPRPSFPNILRPNRTATTDLANQHNPNRDTGSKKGPQLNKPNQQHSIPDKRCDRGIGATASCGGNTPENRFERHTVRHTPCCLNQGARQCTFLQVLGTHSNPELHECHRNAGNT